MGDPITRRMRRIGAIGAVMLASSAALIAGAGAQFHSRGSDEGLDVQFGRFDCAEGYEGGFDKCSLWIEADLRGPSWVNGFAEIHCEVSIEAFEEGDGWGRDYAEVGAQEIGLRHGLGETAFAVTVDLSNFSNDVYVEAKLSDAACWVE